jgi:four helix bundle protein
MTGIGEVVSRARESCSESSADTATRGSEARRVEDLDVFKLAHALALHVYRLTASFPREENFGLVAQLRRASASVGANLAEGGGRLGRAEYRHFVGIAKGSVAEIGYHLLLARDLGHVSREEYARLHTDYDRVGQMLTRLSQALR